VPDAGVPGDGENGEGDGAEITGYTNVLTGFDAIYPLFGFRCCQRRLSLPLYERAFLYPYRRLIA